jgi:hypothetical protein
MGADKQMGGGSTSVAEARQARDHPCIHFYPLPVSLDQPTPHPLFHPHRAVIWFSPRLISIDTHRSYAL